MVPKSTAGARVDAPTTAAPNTGPVRRARDRRGQRQPDPVHAVARPSEDREVVLTDGEGRFRTGRRFAAGELEVWFIDHRPVPKSPFGSRFRTFRTAKPSHLEPDWEPNGDELAIEAAVGPTWNLHLTPEPDQPVEDAARTPAHGLRFRGTGEHLLSERKSGSSDQLPTRAG